MRSRAALIFALPREYLEAKIDALYDIEDY